MDKIMLSNAEVKYVNCYYNERNNLCSTLQLKQEVNFMFYGEMVKWDHLFVYPSELKNLVECLTGFELDEIKPQRVLSKLHSLKMTIEGILDEDMTHHSFRVIDIEFTEEVIDDLQSLAEVNGLSESFIAKRNERMAKATAARAKAKIKAKAAAEAEAAETTDTLSKLREAVVAAEEALAANPSPSNKGRVTRAKKALAAAEAAK